MKILCLVGRSGSGKTTVLERWLDYLRSLGWRVGALKHSHHSLPAEPPHKDSARLQGVLTGWVAADGVQLRGEFDRVELARWLSERVDLLLVEGGKSWPFPKIEVLRGQPPMMQESALLATIGDRLGALPCLPLDDPEAWTAFYTNEASRNKDCSALPKLSS
ncbi:MAG: molybdopterin-guanine dinucleotide biosynthesis protein MobB [Candidatus Eremiobacteraeota bacterium]|nr:molybdopterin-guanine dinucleotide biosynthesis protein MobB [Candidatus Eremiobacteraeota bacterium]MCW5871726.1 molybdopterin-guanine dinucleotide biosynthesis protein MobB [Candidatus Eremiobacteraeota bacterium]